MNENDFEGSIVLERLAEIGKVDAFFQAIDEDNFKKAIRLMKQAGLDQNTIADVIKLINQEFN